MELRRSSGAWLCSHVTTVLPFSGSLTPLPLPFPSWSSSLQCTCRARAHTQSHSHTQSRTPSLPHTQTTKIRRMEGPGSFSTGTYQLCSQVGGMHGCWSLTTITYFKGLTKYNSFFSSFFFFFNLQFLNRCGILEPPTPISSRFLGFCGLKDC